MATNMEAKKKNNNIKRMYNTLRQQIEEEEYEDALNICEKAGLCFKKTKRKW